MLGAILGDIIGSPYEKRHATSVNANDFPLFSENSRFTDDTVMTVAVGEGLLYRYIPNDMIQENIISSMQNWGREYPHAGYGKSFKHWIESKNPQPYGSWANGAAMRVSSAGWLYKSLAKTLEVAKITAEVTHNHPDAIKGTQAVAGAIFLARNGANQKEIKDFIMTYFGYNLNQKLAEIIPNHGFDITCAGTVRDAFIALLEAESFEQAVRNAVSIGGDTNTLAAICGSIAEPLFGIPDKLIQEAEKRITSDMKAVLCNFFIERYGDGPEEIWIPEQWKEKLENHFISTINPKNIWGCSVGYGPDIDMLYTDEQNKIHYFHASGLNDDFDIGLLENKFPALDNFGENNEHSKGWKWIYLGCGHSLQMKDSLYKKIRPYIKAIPEYEMYNKWFTLSLKVLLRMGYSLYSE